MRVIILFLSLLLLLQPASWAMGHAVVGMHHGAQSLQEIAAGKPANCDTATDLPDQDQANVTQQTSIGQTAPDRCLLTCLSACTSSSNYTPVASAEYALHNFTVVIETPSVSFRSHTESPGIRPPRPIRSHG